MSDDYITLAIIMPRGLCRLCGFDSELQESHILPAFAYRWLRETSGNGHIRDNQTPNRRIQDGLKEYWLCAECEGRFSKAETAFAGRIFHPYLSSPGKILPYSSWLLQFCASVSWRVLRYYKDGEHLSDYDQEAMAHVGEAEATWRAFLLGRLRHPGRFQQHLLPLDQISSATGHLAPNINRYLMRAIHMDICTGSKSIFTYSKLGRFIVLGFVNEPHPDSWRGTKVHATRGFVEPRNYVVPRAFGDYLNEKAKSISDAHASVSERQQAKIDKAFRANLDRFIESDAFTAINADVKMFGSSAFAKSRGGNR